MDLAGAIAATVSAIPEEDQLTSVAYVAEAPFVPGDVLYVDRHREVVSRPIYLGYVDCQAGKNWGHRCIYVRCGIVDSAVEVSEARFPPTVETGPRRFTAQSIGTNVPSWAVRA
jgi:hypothetical protein